MYTHLLPVILVTVFACGVDSIMFEPVKDLSVAFSTDAHETPTARTKLPLLPKDNSGILISGPSEEWALKFNFENISHIKHTSIHVYENGALLDLTLTENGREKETEYKWRLKRLSSLIPNVGFKESKADGCLITKRRFIEFVSRFLENYDSVAQRFTLSYSPGGYTNDILLWLSLVVKNGIEEIDLMFNDASYPFIPASLFTAVRTSKVPKLKKCVVDDLSSITGLKSLKPLLLGDMNISDDEIDLLCAIVNDIRHTFST